MDSFYDLHNVESPGLWGVLMPCPTILNACALWGVGGILACHSKLSLLISWQPIYTPMQIQTHGELSLPKTPNPGILASIAERHLNSQGTCSTTTKYGLQLVVDFHGVFSGSKSIIPSWKCYLRKPLSPKVTPHAVAAGSSWMWESNLYVWCALGHFQSTTEKQMFPLATLWNPQHPSEWHLCLNSLR